MKIFGIGLHRTGSGTLTKMLIELGWDILKYHHWPETIPAYRSGNVQMQFLEQYDGATDLPIPLLFTELDQVYPDSKFIFTDRNLDSWLHSCERHCAHIDMTQDDLITHDVVFGSRAFDREKWTETYYWQRRRVREYFTQRPDQLLTVHVENDLTGNEVAALARLEHFVGRKSIY